MQARGRPDLEAAAGGATGAAASGRQGSSGGAMGRMQVALASPRGSGLSQLSAVGLGLDHSLSQSQDVFESTREDDAARLRAMLTEDVGLPVGGPGLPLR